MSGTKGMNKLTSGEFFKRQSNLPMARNVESIKRDKKIILAVVTEYKPR